ncbi:MAG: ABC transporter substrate-binding protein [Ethanoligenens sp.]
MKKIATGLLSLALLLSVTACSSGGKTSSSSSSEASSPSTITDMTGATVQLPKKIDHIADSWPAHTEVLMLLGAGKKIVATANTAKSLPWMFKVEPSLNNAVTTTSQTFNTETLAAKNPDIFFMSPGNTNADKIKSMGIPTVQLNFTNYAQMEQCISLTGKILGTDAQKRATKYNAYLEQTIASIKKTTSSIAATQKPKVLHIQSLNPLQIDGSNTIIDDWITTAGGVNAAQGVTGNMKPVSMEQVLQWNPDIIIVGVGGVDGAATIKNDAQWKNVKAVQDGKVYNNPMGVFGWDRYSPEEVLQLQWAAKTLNPDKFKSLDVQKAVQDYYKTYLNYNLSASDAQLILDAKAPQN